ncbi:virulence factor BrkB family protein [Legionella israelensis]|uniref:virulence factor BrkB family protein n=1 Tax=Legionella israelensis TaxID=454 RepID=UPI00118134A5|nr:virulence factor BrkB family protein [Legionella israelensis]QDP73037.1 virulence factor BrkB family protein [Legionella israelensis]
MKWQDKVSQTFNDSKRFMRFVYDHFFEDDCTYRASALAFTSLLAIVPLMSVSLSILASFPVFQDLSDPIQDFIFQNFVPATGKVIQEYLQLFAAQVSRLSIVGVAFLFVTAILLMVTIERAMNKIWRVTTPRHGVTAFLLYWAILSLAPVLLGLSLAATSYVVSIPIVKDQQAPSILINSIPFFLSLFAFTFLYVIVPNCKVKIIHGFCGALVAAVLFETAKLGFAYYLTQYNTYQLLYGAFASVPIFFVWVYWVWIITLLGAEISYALSVHYQRRTGKPIDGFSHALLWLNLLWEAQQEGKGLEVSQLIDASQQPYEIKVDEMIKKLTEKKLIHSTEEDVYMLSRDLNQISLYQLSQLLPYRLPSVEELQNLKTSYAANWIPVLSKNDEQIQKLFSINLSHLFEQKKA